MSTNMYTCKIGGIQFDNNVWNAPVPQSFHQLQELNMSDSGAIVFKTVTKKETIGNPNSWKITEDGNSLNNVALHNGGIEEFITTVTKLKTKLNKPIFVSLFGQFEDIMYMIDELNKLDIVLLIEWNISCPNTKENIIVSKEIIQKLREHSNHPFGIKTGLNQDIDHLLNEVDFISAINTVNGHGGKCIHTKAVERVRLLASKTITPIIGIGGAETREDVDRFIKAGATAVEIGTGYLKYGVKVFKKVNSVTNLNQQLINSLFDHQIVKTGDFVLKNGEKSDIYVDFRDAFSIPSLWETLVIHTLDKIKNLRFDIVCGVPTGAVPLASIIALYTRKPLIVIRETTKTHGRKRAIEGMFKVNDRCLLIEDVITTGSSVQHAKKLLEEHKIQVNNVFVLLNRGVQNNFHNLYSLFTLDNLIYKELPPKKDSPSIELLKSTIQKKQSRLCFSADITDPRELLAIVDLVGEHICMLKLHFDIIKNTTTGFRDVLALLAKKHGFLIFEDRKFVDIGSIVGKQMTQIESNYYPDFVTVCLLSGKEVIDQLPEWVGIFLVGQMSSNSADPLYTRRVAEMAAEHPRICGVIAQEKICENVLHLVPGVQIGNTNDGMGQKYRTPEDVKDFADIIIVGRGIYGAEDPATAAKEYKNRLQK